MKEVGRLTICVLLLLGCSMTALACRCLSFEPACQAFWKTDAVFSGKVISITPEPVPKHYGQEMPPNRVVRFLVSEPFRGVNSSEIEIVTERGDGGCGFEFQIGEQYIVYAHRRTTDNRLWTSICSRTSLSAKAKEDLAYLQDLSRAENGSIIFGQISRERLSNERVDRSPMSDVRILVEGESHQFETTSDEKGKYILRGLTPGKFKISLDLPKGLAAHSIGLEQDSKDVQVELVDKGCASVNFGVMSDGRLSGTAFDVAGQPREKAELTLMEAGKEKYQGYSSTVYSDKEGKYEFTYLPPGRYVMRIRFDGSISDDRPFPPLYYPNYSVPTQANVITIGEGQWVEKVNVFLPSLPPEFVVEGIVVWPDGQPISTARVRYDTADPGGYSATVDNQGRFLIKVYQGVTIFLRASVEAKGRVLESQVIRVTDGLTKLRVIVPRN